MGRQKGKNGFNVKNFKVKKNPSFVRLALGRRLRWASGGSSEVRECVGAKRQNKHQLLFGGYMYFSHVLAKILIVIVIQQNRRQFLRVWSIFKGPIVASGFTFQSLGQFNEIWKNVFFWKKQQKKNEKMFFVESSTSKQNQSSLRANIWER